MELDWYSNKVSADAVLTPTSSFRWMSTNASESERQGGSRWHSLLNLMQERGFLRGGSSSGDEYSPPGSNTSSPKKRRDPQCSRSLSGGSVRCPADSQSSLSTASSKSHICFGCVLHSHTQ